jgi:prepilin-type processing-associated H-X9-DG protein
VIVLKIIAWVLLALSVGGLIFWGVLLYRMTLMLIGARKVSDGVGLPAPQGGWPKLSIIVPAHNEEEMIGECARLLRAQDYEDLEIVFVLDRCTDGTAAALAPHAAADSRVVVIENDTCPEDWAGKCHAAHLGAQRATGQWLLFTDADTQFAPELARAAMALALARGLALLSLWSTLTYAHPFERIAQLAASMYLMIMYPITRAHGTEQPRPFANGQFMLFDRAWYDRMGGHAAVKDDLLEDIAAARQVHSQGGRTNVLFADGMLMVSMYETLAAFETGWKRIYIEACNRRPARLRKWARRTFWSGAALPVLQLATLIAAPFVVASGDTPLAAAMVGVVLAGWAAQLVVLWRATTLAHAPRRSMLFYPFGCRIVARVMSAAARDLARGEPVVWGGRRYVLEPR